MPRAAGLARRAPPRRVPSRGARPLRGGWAAPLLRPGRRRRPARRGRAPCPVAGRARRRRRRRAALRPRRAAGRGCVPRRVREEHALPLHMHVAEQAREIDECLAETGSVQSSSSPTRGSFEALRRRPRHASRASRGETPRRGRRVRVHLRDDRARPRRRPTGHRRASRRRGAAVHRRRQPRLADPIEELRSLETHERLRRQSRVTFAPRRARLQTEQLLAREGSSRVPPLAASGRRRLRRRSARSPFAGARRRRFAPRCNRLRLRPAVVDRVEAT